MDDRHTHSSEFSFFENRTVRSAAERGDASVAHYAVRVLGIYAEDPSNESFLFNPQVLDDEIPNLLADLMLLAERSGLDWEHLLGEAERRADEDRLIGSCDQLPDTEDDAE